MSGERLASCIARSAQGGATDLPRSHQDHGFGDSSLDAGAAASPTGRGALAEVAFGVKDVIETRGLATEYGSPIYKGRIGTADAAIVRELRGRGGVLLGKTQTATFAYQTPPLTHNPRNALPLRLQLTAEHGRDARVLRAAVRLHAMLHA